MNFKKEKIMKRITFAVISLACLSVQAQDTYLNERLTNNSNDVIGTARYVGMGGAMGALGADISTISWNPAGLGLLRKSDVSLSFGGLWGTSRIKEENRGTGSFDQMGFVYSIRTQDHDVPYVNLGFNYQKKANYNYNFYADNNNLKGLSQMDQLAEFLTYNCATQYNLAGLMGGMNSENDNSVFEEYTVDGEKRYKNLAPGSNNFYTHHSEGGLQGYDFSASVNIKDRGYVGLTIGVDNMNYRNWSTYTEIAGTNDRTDDYEVYNDVKITGYGLNVKLGTIVRPIEESSFRFGLVVETPTWYRLKNSTYYSANVKNVSNTVYDNYLEYTLRTPWKLRAGIGSTVGSWMAWDVDYEFAHYGFGKMGYPKFNERDEFSNSFANDRDRVMEQHTKNTLKAAHTLRAGLEFRPASAWAVRLGYNHITSSYKEGATFDQVTLAEGSTYSYAMNYAVNTSYMNLGATNILTLGLGFKYKAFYADLAYKVRRQKADFYAFDCTYTNSGSDFSEQNPTLTGERIDPVDVDLTRQTFTCTLGFRF